MRTVLALGSNLGRRFQTLQGAVDALFDAPGLEFVAVSPVLLRYFTKGMENVYTTFANGMDEALAVLKAAKLARCSQAQSNPSSV